MKKIWIIGLLLFAAMGFSFAQNTQDHKCVRTESVTLQNTNGSFVVNAVGQVLVKESVDGNIRCEVRITGHGNTEEQACERTNNIAVNSHPGGTYRSPKLDVTQQEGVYAKQRCEVLTIVYVPANVSFQLNDNSGFMGLIRRAIEKAIPW